MKKLNIIEIENENYELFKTLLVESMMFKHAIYS